MKLITIDSIKIINQPLTVWDLKVEPFQFYIANGIITHNKTQAGCFQNGIYPTTASLSWINTYSGASTRVEYGTGGINGSFTLDNTYPPTTTTITARTGGTYTYRVRHEYGSYRSPWVYTTANIPADGGQCCYPCLSGDSLILLDKDELRPVEDIVVGDRIISIDIPNIPTTNEVLLTHTQKELSFTETTTVVTENKPIIVDSYYSINEDQLKMSAWHINMIQRDNIWQFVQAKDLRVGDILPQI